MDTPSNGPYLVQCLSSHVAEALAGTELEARCIERVEKGSLSALIIGHDDCIQCVADAQYQRNITRDNAEYICLNTNPGHDLDCDGCLTPEEVEIKFPPIPDSRYNDQMRMALPW